jgi:hypothetical protein
MIEQEWLLPYQTRKGKDEDRNQESWFAVSPKRPRWSRTRAQYFAGIQR